MTGTQDANSIDLGNDPIVSNSGSTFNGHNYVSFGSGSGLITSSALFSGDGSRTVVAVYSTPAGDNGGINPIAGQAGPGSTGQWFVLQARDKYAAGSPYLAGFSADTSSGTNPVANQLTFAVATYSSSGAEESLYWAYGDGSVAAPSTLSVTLNTYSNPFTIGFDQGGETASDNMQIGQLLVYSDAVTATQADAIIHGLQAYYYEVPEPSALSLMLAGGVALILIMRRRQRSL